MTAFFCAYVSVLTEMTKGLNMTSTSLAVVASTPLLTAYYDGSCALCSAEMSALHDLDRDGAIAMVDCADVAFDDTGTRREGVSRDDMMQTLHVRDVLGDWHRGVDAIALLYATAGAPRLARWWVHPLTRPIARWLYPMVVRHRHALSAVGIHFVAPAVLRRFATRRGRCDHATCRPMAPL
jgi:predicted DCC family thiol-disulfide oxidoreductase YuxK